jgi:hypothetical protein
MASKLITIKGGNGSYPSANGISFGGNARTIAFQGTFDGEINIAASYDGGTTFITLTDSDGSNLNISTDSIVNIAVGNGVKLQFNVTGSSVSENTDVEVFVA